LVILVFEVIFKWCIVYLIKQNIQQQ